MLDMKEMKGLGVAEVEDILGWAVEEGWNPGLDDAAAFHAADPHGFFGAYVDGALAAGISVVRHSAEFAFLGLFICKPEFRGKGLGSWLWYKAVSHAQGRVIGLEGVPEQELTYQRRKFRSDLATTRFKGRLEARESRDLRAMAEADIKPLIAMEWAASGSLKPAYMEAWLRGAATRQTLVLEANGAPVGFAVVRKCRDGDYKIGPLVAPDLPAARALLAGAGRIAEGGDVSLDVPGQCEALADLARGQGLEPVSTTRRMYCGGRIEPGRGIYAVGTLELG